MPQIDLRIPLALGVAALVLCACASHAPVPSPPEARKPAPETVTRANPAGDAPAAEDAALTRLLEERAGRRPDRFRTLDIYLPDVRNWRRVRIFGLPMRAAFRYGDDIYAAAMIEYRPADQPGATPDDCLRSFVARADRTAARFAAKLLPLESGVSRHKRGVEAALDPTASSERSAEMPFVRASGVFDSILKSDRYVGAAVAYRSWPGTCLIQGFGARVGTDEALAKRVVERWLDEFAPRLRWDRKLRAAPPFKNR